MFTPDKTVMICVDFADILEQTLPRNRHHFQQLVVMTHPDDHATIAVCQRNDVECVLTEVFYERGAEFNKFAALEMGLDYVGRAGWILIMDCDIVLPNRIPDSFVPTEGCLYTPRRRDLRAWQDGILPDQLWKRYRYVNAREEFAGYYQLFHGSDPVLSQQPWFGRDWRWAGTADTFFQRRWKANRQIRPPFEVLHLGIPYANWAGRVQPYGNGEIPEKSEERKQKYDTFLRQRTQVAGHDDRYKGEKIWTGLAE